MRPCWCGADPRHIRLFSRPVHSAQLYAVGHDGDTLRETQSHNRAVDSFDVLEDQVVVELLGLQTDYERIESICADISLGEFKLHLAGSIVRRWGGEALRNLVGMQCAPFRHG